ncbi:MAG: NB-ARC domain-containing protein [Leptolyngbyaceae cyanobacterium bins.302]|nr:NB-ARC domain-containing protein [Leptolyngbyaceae cyanobacterium bins.302]
MLNCEEALIVVQEILEQVPLNKTQVMVFAQIWMGLSYQEIAKQSGYNEGYVRSVGATLLQLLTHALGERVTKHNVRSILKRYLEKGSVVTTRVTIAPHLPTTQRVKQQDWGEAIDVSNFWGRSRELSLLQQWILGDRCRLVGVTGASGIGKTALSVKLAETIQQDFDFVIWRSLRYAPAIQDLLASVIQFLSAQTTETNELPANVGDRISYLISLLRQSRCLLVLSHFHCISSNPQTNGSQHNGDFGELLRRVGETQHQSCLVVTSRMKPDEIAVLQGNSLPTRALTLTGLDPLACQQILNAKGFAQGKDTARLIEWCEGNPLLLKLAATRIQDAFQGNILKFLSYSSSSTSECLQNSLP